jgi:hypothetical protein
MALKNLFIVNSVILSQDFVITLKTPSRIFTQN